MTCRKHCTLPELLLEQITEQGLGTLVRSVINTTMQAEQEAYLGAAACKRIDSQREHANGYKPKTVATRVEVVTYDVPTYVLSLAAFCQSLDSF